MKLAKHLSTCKGWSGPKSPSEGALFYLQGNVKDYGHPANSMIPAVLLTRQGIPITLCIIHAAVGRRVGLDIQGKPPESRKYKLAFKLVILANYFATSPIQL